MKPRPHGNGSGRFEIGQADMGGWLRVFPTKAEDLFREDLGVYLSQSLTEWFRQRPNFRMKCAMPIVREGATVEMHVVLSCAGRFGLDRDVSRRLFGQGAGFAGISRDAPADSRAPAQYSLRRGSLSEYRRVLEVEARDGDDPRQHLHARLHLLQRRDRAAGPARSA